MPKIPTFTAQGIPTAESASIKTSFQVPLSGVGSPASALEPVIKTLNDYYAKEQAVVEKTQALELENKASIELEETKARISKSADPITSSDIFLQYSKQIKEKYADQAPSSSVKNLFLNNYLVEEKKQLSSVVIKNRENLIQDRINQADIKEQRILTTGLYSDNQLQKETMYSDLGILYQDLRKDFIIDEDTYQKKIREIPSIVQTLEAKRDMGTDPVGTAIKLNDANNYPDIIGEKRIKLINEANSDARPAVMDGMKNHFALIESGMPSKFDEKSIKPILGQQAYADFKEKESGLIIFKGESAKIFNAKIGTESSIIANYPIRPGSEAFDLEMKQKLINFASKKDEMLKKDPASIVMQFNQNVKEKYSDFTNETDPVIKDRKFQKYIGSVIDAQKLIGVNDEKIKVLPQQDAARIVQDYNNQDVNGKIKYLSDLEKTYGDNYGRLLNQLTEPENGLPITAEFVSYLGDSNFAKQALSIDTKEERDRLDKYISTTTESKKSLQSEIANQLTDFRKVVMMGNPFVTSVANKKLNNIQEVLTYVAANKMSRGMSMDDAVKESTSYINDNFVFRDTYFIPRIYNNERLTKAQIEHIDRKASYIKDANIDKLDLESFKSNDKKISQDILDKGMKNQIKENGMWINSADGNSLVLAVKFYDGSIGILNNKKGEQIKINFNDTSSKLPNSNENIDFSKIIEKDIGFKSKKIILQ
jgi:hypothetical protein